MLSESTQTVPLGKTTIAVPPLCVGTWAWGDKFFWSYGKDYDEAQLKETFDASIDAGVTFFDTAEIYGLGESERLISRFMQPDRPVQIATKYFPFPWRFNDHAVSEALTASLERLQVSQVALYQVHMPFDFLISKRSLMNALADEVEKGRIGAIGVSNYSAEQMRQAHSYLAARGIPLAVNQVQYSLLGRKIETNGILDAARELEITILAYSPLSQGLLTGKYRGDETPLGARRISPQFSKQGLEKISPVLDALQTIATLHDRTPAQVALNWLIAQGVVPIPGAKNPSQARQNAGALGWSLTSDDLAQIDQLTRSFR